MFGRVSDFGDARARGCRWGGGLPWKLEGLCHVLAADAYDAPDGVCCHGRQKDAVQPDQPHILEPQGWRRIARLQPCELPCDPRQLSLLPRLPPPRPDRSSLDLLFFTPQELELAADFYTPVDDTSIPTGEIRAVSGAMDLRAKATIADHGLTQADQGMGYDHNWCLRATTGADGLRPVARVYEPTSGRSMMVRTSEPGVQFYTGNYLDGLAGRDGSVSYAKHHGFCLETQHFPDAVNRAHFPSVWLEPGQRYRHVTEHTFGSSTTPPMGDW